MENSQNPNDVPIIEIKKPILKKRWKRKKHRTCASRENYLADHEEGSVKVYNERLRLGLMIFPHEKKARVDQMSKGFAICPYELEAGKVKWKSRTVGLAAGKTPHFIYDMIHIDQEDVKKFVGALAYIAGLVPRGPGHELKKKNPADKLSEIDKGVMKFRL
jgi:hypothetical protein